MKENRRKIIIVVDDDTVILKLALSTLEDEYDVFTMPSAKKLFQILESVTPDLILMDLLMPEMDGHEAVKELKKSRETANIPVIFLTSQIDQASELEGLNMGAVDYIGKPFSPGLLKKRVGIHILIESQKKQLMDWNDNLTQMVEEKSRSVVELQHAVLYTMSNLVESRDDITGGHIERTEHLLRLLTEEVLAENSYSDVLGDWDLNIFFSSAKLHDVGKISIKDNILLKPGPLSNDEFEEMKKHTTFGEKIIESIQASVGENDFLMHAKILAGTHHEKWDGSGYPRGLAAEAIPLQGRLMAIVDVYDALVCERPYKGALSHNEAVEIIENEKGSHFDPLITRAFLEIAEPRIGI
ncbi:MAG: response regulator [Clostridiales Family XIII bacterium]|nr:response regulator [Clostridiales Family XIII bacterium]